MRLLWPKRPFSVSSLLFPEVIAVQLESGRALLKDKADEDYPS